MVKILIINNSENNNKEFSYRIEKILSDTNHSFASIAYTNQRGINHNDYDKIILTGSPKGNDIVSHHLPFYSWILNYPNGLLGICAGHHIIGSLFGSELIRNTEAEYGYYYCYPQVQDPLLEGLEKKALVKQMHNDSITLPDNFELLASSDQCLNQAMRHKLQPIYSLQFHPEFINENIIRNFIDLI